MLVAYLLIRNAESVGTERFFRRKKGVPHQKKLRLFGKCPGRFWPFLGLPGLRGGQKRIPRPVLIKMGGFSANAVVWGPVSWRYFVSESDTHTKTSFVKKATPYQNKFRTPRTLYLFMVWLVGRLVSVKSQLHFCGLSQIGGRFIG